MSGATWLLVMLASAPEGGAVVANAATEQTRETSAQPQAGAAAPTRSDVTAARAKAATEQDETAVKPGAAGATRGDVTAAVANAATEDEASVRPWEVGGFVDVNYSFNSNLPDSHVNRGTAVQPRTGEFTPNMAVVYVRRDAPTGRLAPMFELALQVGPAADALMSTEPRPGGMGSKFAGAEVWKHLARANVGLKTRGGTEVSAGLFVSPVGVGIHWSPFNWNYTVSWELNSVPYYLAGLRVVHPFNKEHAVQGWIINGWQTLGDVNKAPAIMLGYTYTPSANFALAEYAYFGPENADIRLRAWRMFSDTQFTYNVQRFGVGGLFDVGAERRTDLIGAPWQMWMTAALFTRWQLLASKPVAGAAWKQRSWDMAARPEWFWDRDGRMFGVPQQLVGLTFTNDVRVLQGLMLRVEYRYDRSTSANGFFYRGAAISDDARGLARDQHTVFFSVAGVLAQRFGGGSR